MEIKINVEDAILFVLTAFCEDARMKLSDNLILLWAYSLEDYSREVIMEAFKQVAKNRSRNVGFNVKHDEFAETCRAIRTRKIREYNPEKYNNLQLEHTQEKKTVEQREADKEHAAMEYQRIKKGISENTSIPECYQETILLFITEQFSKNGRPASYICENHVDPQTFRDEVKKQYGRTVKRVNHEKAKTKATDDDGQRIVIESDITVGYLI